MDQVERIQKTKSGVKWSFWGQFINQGSSVVFAIFLTRILEPDVFGLIGMVLVFSGILQVLKDFGINNALIYKKNTTNKDYNTAFWAQLGLGVSLSAIFVLASQTISNFYNEPFLKEIALAISMVFVIDSFGYVHIALLRKKMLFKRIYLVEALSIIVSGIVSIVFALNSCGAWSLVAKLLIYSSVQTILLWLANTWRPSFCFSRRIFREHLMFGLPLVMNQMTTYLMRNGDNLLIGKFSGAEALGCYNRAYSLMMLPIKQIVNMYCVVIFPSFSQIRDNNIVLKNNWIKIIRLTAFFMLPVSCLMFLLSEDFVILVFGDKWLKIIYILKCFAWAASAQTIFEANYLFISKGENSKMFVINLMINIFLLSGVCVGIPYGINMVALFYMAISVTIIPLVTIFYTTKLVDCNPSEILNGIMKIFSVNISVFLICYCLKDLVDLPSVINLFILPIVYCLLYFLHLKIFNEKIYKDFFDLMSKR